MTARVEHRGIVVPMISPVTPEGDLDEKAARQVVDDLAEGGQRGRTLGQGTAALKAGMAAMSLCGAAVLPPLRPLSEEEQRKLREELVTLGVV